MEDAVENTEHVETESVEAVQQDSPWYSDIAQDDSTAGYIQAKGWKDAGDILESYRNLEKFRGVSEDKLLKLPDEQTPESMRGIYEQLGAAKSVDEYQVTMPDNMEVDEGLLGQAREFAFESGMSTSQFQQLVDIYNQSIISGANNITEEYNTNREIQENQLKQDWGSQYQESLFLAEQAMREVGVSDEQRAVLEAGLGVDGTAKLFNKVGSSLQEVNVDSKASSDFGMTPEKARYEMDTILSRASTDRSVAEQFQKATGPEYDRYKQLMKLRHGE